MKIDTQPLEDHQVKLTVEVENSQLNDAKIRAARKIAQRVKIPGFRPGKAPYQVVLRQYGEEAIMEEAFDLLVQDVYPKAIEEAGIQPYGPGELEKVVSTDPPVFEFVVPLEAQVILGDYKSIRRPYNLLPVEEQKINEVIENLRSSQAIIEPVDRPAQVGDMVYVRLSGSRLLPDENGNTELVHETTYPFVIEDESSSAKKEEWPFPGFSGNLVGLSANDTLVVKHTFAEDAEYESLRGVETEFNVTVESVKSRTLPELNDEFASSAGDYANFDELKQNIKERLEQQAKSAYDEDYEEEILKEVIELSTIKYPPQMLEREIDSVIHNLEHRLEDSNQDLDLYLKSRQMKMEDLRKEAQPTAENGMKRSLVLLELAKVENIQVEPEELQAEARKTVDYLSQTLPEKEARKLSNRQVFGNLVGNIMADLLTQRSLERLRQISSGELDDTEVTDEINPQPAEETLDTESKTDIVEESPALTNALSQDPEVED